MPVLTTFLGITIRMYFQQAEHNPPHIHVLYGEHAAAIAVRDGVVLDGYLPVHQLGQVQEWVVLHREELLDMWDTQQFHSIRPLD